MRFIGALVVGVVLGGCAVGPQPLPVEPIPELGKGSDTCAKMLGTVSRTEPRYPAAARQSRQTGWVILDFDVAEDGSTGNFRVIRSSPPGIFESATLEAMRNWKYPPGPSRKDCRMDMRFNVK